MSFARGRGEDPGAEHLLVALLDQGTPGVAEALSRAGLDSAAVRRAALAAIGAAAGDPRIVLPPLTPAGTMDRPPLPVAGLDGRAWTALQWRQDHLPVDRVRRRPDLEALSHLERDMAWRLTQRPGLEGDQRYSLIWHHSGRVGQRLALARPDLAGLPRVPGRPAGAMAMSSVRRRHAFLNLTAGWGRGSGTARWGFVTAGSGSGRSAPTGERRSRSGPSAGGYRNKMTGVPPQHHNRQTKRYGRLNQVSPNTRGPLRTAVPRAHTGGHGPDHRDNPRRDPRHMACLHGCGRDRCNAQDVSHHRADRDGRLHRRAARGQAPSSRLARRSPPATSRAATRLAGTTVRSLSGPARCGAC